MRKLSWFVVVGLAVASAGIVPARAQGALAQSRIVEAVDDSKLTTLQRNTHPLARAEFDQGSAPVNLPMERMQLVLTRSAAQETALKNLLEKLHDPSSSQYHQWLTPQQFGQQFGTSDQDIQIVTAWLQSHGFQVNHVANGRNLIDFSGTAEQVQQAFHTEIHKYVVNGQAHWANSGNPQIPTALASVVAGVSTLHNFVKKPQLIKTSARIEAEFPAGSASPQFTSSGGVHALAPADYATIYNINPLYSAGINGSGTTIAVVARSNITLSDIISFRSTLGLVSNTPNIIINGTDPGILGNGEVDEATLDTSWAGVVAPNAKVNLVISASTNTADGADLSEAYIVDNNLGDVMTESFGDCEANYTAAEQAAISNLAQQAAAQGITYTVAAGDAGAEGCDDPSTAPATGPISVNILASTAYNIAVGGTIFNDTANPAAFWASTNGTNDETALSYIPEDVWNESCDTNCTGGNSPGLWAGGGGKSTFVSKPSWQAGVTGIPGDGARDLPDVSLTAAGHDAYLLCLNGSCTPDSRGHFYFQGYSGTSAATPSFAGIIALAVQKTGSRQGQADYTLYKLAATEDLSRCNASNTSSLPDSSYCIFNDVTVGNNAVPGESGYGTSSAAYQAGAGYDLATGLGSVNVTNLLNGWSGAGAVVAQIRIGVDRPTSDNATLVGVQQLYGWAVADNSSIISVLISVDGVPYGSATYGASRPDVCVSVQYAGCPNVGWTLSLDTTSLADGSHTLGVTAQARTGQIYTTSSGFTVANWTTSDPIHVSIDSPNAQSAAFSGGVNFGGWALSDISAISQVAISIDGVSFGNAGYGASRADVCAIYTNRPGCPNIGWNFYFNTALLADGTHTLEVTPTSAGGQSATATQTFTVSNASGSPIIIDIDQPAAQASAVSGAYSIFGWALSNNGSISNVTILLDGVAYQSAIYGSARPDVCQVYLGRAGCPNVGWSGIVDTTSLSDGAHTLDVRAVSSTGQELTASRSFSVANAGVSLPTKVVIDQPNSQSSTVQGAITVRGWAINDVAAVNSVIIMVDSSPVGHATYGASRPDVCAVYSGRAGCPDVGWIYSLDTSQLSNGTHTLAATASAPVTSGTQTATASTQINVANWTTSNPFRINIDAPASGAALSGSTSIAGWAIDDIAAISSVSVAVDGVSFGNATYGGNRADVCAIYSGRAGCPNVGWNAPLNTTLLADGTHTLEITATSAGGQHSTSTSTFKTSNASTNSVLVNIDTPSASSTITGTTHIAGWAIDTKSGVAISSVQILMDGVLVGTASYGASRGDVCNVYAGAAGCPNVGWDYQLNTTGFTSGTHALDVLATAADGTDRTVSVTVNVTNGPYASN